MTNKQEETLIRVEYPPANNPNIEVLNALNELRDQYVYNSVGCDSISDHDFVRALKYFAKLVDSE